MYRRHIGLSASINMTMRDRSNVCLVIITVVKVSVDMRTNSTDVRSQTHEQTQMQRARYTTEPN